MKAVGYIRVSTEQQTEKYGIPRQEEAIQKFCLTRGIELVNMYVDAGKSGAMKDDEDLPQRREQLLAMFDHIMEADDIEAVIVIKTDRLWRNSAAETFVCKRLRRLNVDIVSVEEQDFTLFPNSPTQKFLNKVNAALAELDYDNIKKRLADGRRVKATSTGYKPAGNTPFGYVFSSDKKTVLIQKEEAVIIKELYRLKLEGERLQDITDLFERKNYRNRNGNFFSKQSLLYMLRNPFYAGILTHGDIQIKGCHTPLVNRADWIEINPSYEITV